MALRLTTTQVEDTSAAWQPNTETIIQAEAAPGVYAVLAVDAKVHADAPWKEIGSLITTDEAFKRFAQMPYMRLRVSKNKSGATFQAWDNQ